MEVLELQLTVVGLCRIGQIKDFEKEGKATGRSSLTLRYEGGSSELLVASSVIAGLEVGMLVDVWLEVEPHDVGYEYQGKYRSKPGFAVIGVKAIRPHQEKAGK